MVGEIFVSSKEIFQVGSHKGENFFFPFSMYTIVLKFKHHYKSIPPTSLKKTFKHSKKKISCNRFMLIWGGNWLMLYAWLNKQDFIGKD